MEEDTYEFDLYEKKVTKECNLYPADTSESNVPYLHAVNNKYPPDSLDPKKVGKWMIFLPKDSVNSAWDKIKMAVTTGKLWQSCVSTCDPRKPNETHTIMTFTRNYADIDDVIRVLDFLESSGIKPPNVTSMYQPEEYTREFSKPWIYTSDTVRAMASDYTYEFDISKKEVVTNCNLCPTKVFKIPSFLTTKNNKYLKESVDPEKVGKWMFHLPKDSVDAVWDKIKTAVTNGELWCSKVSTTDPEESKDYAFMIYTKDYTDLDDVVHVLNYLETSRMKPPNENIKYSKDEQASTDMSKGGRGKSWIYSSNLIRSMGSSVHPHYKFDIVKKELVTDSKLYPTETLKSDYNWLSASNNKFANDEKAGHWVLLVPKDGVNAIWDKIKIAITNGELWRSRVSTTDPKRPDDPYTLMVCTEDYIDVDDAICVLDYLEKSRIKPPGVNIKFKTDPQTDTSRKDEQERWLYTSDTIRTTSPISYTYEFDVCKKKVVIDCNLYPTDFFKIPPWLDAQNNKYADESVDNEKVGYWSFFFQKDSVNVTWDKIKTAVTSGELWRCNVSTVDPKKFGDLHFFMVATKDYTDVDDVIRVLDFLESSKIKPSNKNIKYVKGESTLEAARKTANTGRSWIYSANLIRSVGSSIRDTYKFDIHKKELITDCKLYPTKTLKSDFELLKAENNKYAEETLDPEKMGKWIVPLPKVCVNAAWDKIKTAVSNGELWRCSVSTTDPKISIYIVMIYTKDYTDGNDVIRVLEHLESSGIKPCDQNIKYKKEKGTGSGEIGRSFIYTSNLIRSKGSSISNHYELDIHKKELVSDSTLYPTETLKSDFEWLHAINNKYTDKFEYADGINFDNTGKWMIFLRKDEINATWDKIKMAVTNGELWQAKVSTTDPERPGETYAIMIYTKDYTDVDDVIQVLNYLESSGIKPPNVTLKYKRDQQTYTGIYSGGREKSWTYSSDLIRCTGGFIQDQYEYDILKRALVTDSDLNPTKALGRPPWLYAKNNKYLDDLVDPGKVGKWILFLREDHASAVWDKVKTAVANGELWCNKVSTFKKKNYPVGDSYTLMIYTKDSTDREDVIQVLDYLESSGIKPPSADIKYRTDDILKTETGFRSDHKSGPKPWLYSSNTIRSSGFTRSKDNSIHDTYEFDIRRREVITECNLCPTQIRGEPSWLYAKNNKYPNEVVDPKKVGKWVLYLREDVVNATWDKIKTAVASGELWSAKVSTFWQRNYPVGDSYTVMINTKDCTDKQDVIHVLDFLESAKIKPPSENITYRSDDQSHTGYRTGGQKPMYFSKTVRSELKMDLPWR